MKTKTIIIITVVTIIVLGIFLMAIFSSKSDQVKTLGVVLEKKENSILICEYENSTSLFSIDRRNLEVDIKEGDKIIVTHNGAIQESYPQGFSEIYKIEVDGRADTAVYKEGLLNYLAFLESTLDFASNQEELKDDIMRIKEIISGLK